MYSPGVYWLDHLKRQCETWHICFLVRADITSNFLNPYRGWLSSPPFSGRSLGPRLKIQLLRPAAREAGLVRNAARPHGKGFALNEGATFPLCSSIAVKADRRRSRASPSTELHTVYLFAFAHLGVMKERSPSILWALRRASTGQQLLADITRLLTSGSTLCQLLYLGTGPHRISVLCQHHPMQLVVWDNFNQAPGCQATDSCAEPQESNRLHKGAVRPAMSSKAQASGLPPRASRFSYVWHEPGSSAGGHCHCASIMALKLWGWQEAHQVFWSAQCGAVFKLRNTPQLLGGLWLRHWWPHVHWPWWHPRLHPRCRKHMVDEDAVRFWALGCRPSWQTRIIGRGTETQFFVLEKAYLRYKGYILSRAGEHSFKAFIPSPCMVGPLDAAVWQVHATHQIHRRGDAVTCQQRGAHSKIVAGRLWMISKFRSRCPTGDSRLFDSDAWEKTRIVKYSIYKVHIKI